MFYIEERGTQLIYILCRNKKVRFSDFFKGMNRLESDHERSTYMMGLVSYLSDPQNLKAKNWKEFAESFFAAYMDQIITCMKNNVFKSKKIVIRLENKRATIDFFRIAYDLGLFGKTTIRQLGEMINRTFDFGKEFYSISNDLYRSRGFKKSETFEYFGKFIVKEKSV